MLKKIAATMRRFFRSDDYICRVGGDEFIVLLRQSDPSQRERIRERVRRINQALMDGSDGLPSISLSVGAACGEEGITAAELFNRADRALYDTKHHGGCDITFFVEVEQ